MDGSLWGSWGAWVAWAPSLLSSVSPSRSRVAAACGSCLRSSSRTWSTSIPTTDEKHDYEKTHSAHRAVVAVWCSTQHDLETHDSVGVDQKSFQNVHFLKNAKVKSFQFCMLHGLIYENERPVQMKILDKDTSEFYDKRQNFVHLFQDCSHVKRLRLRGGSMTHYSLYWSGIGVIRHWVRSLHNSMFCQYMWIVLFTRQNVREILVVCLFSQMVQKNCNFWAT